MKYAVRCQIYEKWQEMIYSLQLQLKQLQIVAWKKNRASTGLETHDLCDTGADVLLSLVSI